MSESLFSECVSCFIEKWVCQLLPLEKVGVDVEEEDTSLKIHLPDGGTYVIGPYAPLQQLWVSSPISGGRHFVWREGCWRDTRNNEDLEAMLTEEFGPFYRSLS